MGTTDIHAYTFDADTFRPFVTYLSTSTLRTLRLSNAGSGRVHSPPPAVTRPRRCGRLPDVSGHLFTTTQGEVEIKDADDSSSRVRIDVEKTGPSELQTDGVTVNHTLFDVGHGSIFVLQLVRRPTTTSNNNNNNNHLT